MGDVFKFSESSGEWTFVAGAQGYADPTMEQGVGVPIAGNFSGPGSRVQPSWSAHTRSHGLGAARRARRLRMDCRRTGSASLSRSVCFSFSLCWAFFPCCVFSSIVSLFGRVQRLEQRQAVRLRRPGERNPQRPVRPQSAHSRRSAAAGRQFGQRAQDGIFCGTGHHGRTSLRTVSGWDSVFPLTISRTVYLPGSARGPLVCAP